jgi:hypothetical protein
MTPIKIKFTIEAKTLKTGRLPGGTELELIRDFPFLPRQGDMIAVTPEGSLLQVRTVYWSEEDGFEVNFEYDDLEHSKNLKASGWTEV